jgi:very-short-patch-repair endonuclease
MPNHAEKPNHAQFFPIPPPRRTHLRMTPVLYRLARGQHDLLTLAQFRVHGSRSAWQRAHQRGLLAPVHRGVSRLTGAPATSDQTIAAAVLASNGLASHASAAFLWGAEVNGCSPVDVTVLNRECGLRMAGVRIHRPIDLDDLRPVRRAGIAATNPLRTALDVGAVCGPVVVAGIVEAFIIRRYLGLRTLEHGLRRHSQHGRSGLGPLRIVLYEWALGDKPADSVLEPAMARLLRAGALPPAVFHPVVVTAGGTFELDFGLVDHKLDIEVDGWAHHGSRAAFERDRERDAYLAGVGWQVLRFTWYQVRFRREWVAARISDAVAARP